MSRLLIGLLALTALATTSVGQEPAMGFQPYQDHMLAPIPSGLRFQGVEDPLLQRATGERGWAYIGPPGGGWAGGGGGCNCGGGNMLCSHWTLRGWYASWDDHHGHAGCKTGCCRCGQQGGFGY